MLGWQVTVLDMDLWGMSDTIGSHQLDLAYVYSKPNHEIVEQVRARALVAVSRVGVRWLTGMPVVRS